MMSVDDEALIEPRIGLPRGWSTTSKKSILGILKNKKNSKVTLQEVLPEQETPQIVKPQTPASIPPKTPKESPLSLKPTIRPPLARSSLRMRYLWAKLKAESYRVLVNRQ